VRQARCATAAPPRRRGTQCAWAPARGCRPALAPRRSVHSPAVGGVSDPFAPRAGGCAPTQTPPAPPRFQEHLGCPAEMMEPIEIAEPVPPLPRPAVRPRPAARPPGPLPWRTRHALGQPHLLPQLPGGQDSNPRPPRPPTQPLGRRPLPRSRRTTATAASTTAARTASRSCPSRPRRCGARRQRAECAAVCTEAEGGWTDADCHTLLAHRMRWAAPFPQRTCTSS
jgi:hypothetical protein